MVDMAHIAGLVAAGLHPNPCEYADIVTSTTHKTLRGPRGGIIMWNNPDYCKPINSAVFPGTQGGPLMNIIAAKAQSFIEADTKEFFDYAEQVIENAKAMCEVFNDSSVLKVQTGGTDSHIILLDLTDCKYSGRDAADLLEENGITVNKNGIPTAIHYPMPLHLQECFGYLDCRGHCQPRRRPGGGRITQASVGRL